MELRVTKEQKEFIKNKSEEMGFGSVSAFLMSECRKSFSFKYRYECI